MIKRLIAAAVALGALFVLSAPATATCQPGTIGWEKGRPQIELPNCPGGPR